MSDSSLQDHVSNGCPRAAAEMPRRRFLSLLGWGGLTLAFAEVRDPAVVRAGTERQAGHGGGMGPEEALNRLQEGNKRYVAGRLRHRNQGAKRRTEVAKGQHPFAIVLGCADSRVPPEVVFDQGLGDLFVVRVAGNIADDVALGSIEYAVEHLGTRLILVLGHEKCGAVAAALEAATGGGKVPAHIDSLVKAIQPAVEAVKGQPGDALDNAVRANVGMVVARLKSSEPVLAEMAKAGKVKIVGARYDLQSGAVQFSAV